MGRVHGHVNHAQNRRRVRVGELPQVWILSVACQGVLGQIVGPDGEEVHLSGQLGSHDDRGRGLDHDTHLDILSEVHTLTTQLTLDLIDDDPGLVDLGGGGDHGEHDRDVTEGGSPQDGPELHLEDLRPGQADADGPVSQGRIGLLLQTEVPDLLVGTDIQGADDDRLVTHPLGDLLIGLELELLSREVIAFQVEELAAEETDPLGIVGFYRIQVRRPPDVCVKMDLLALLGPGGLALEFLETLHAFPVLPLPGLIGPQGLFVRVDQHQALAAIHNGGQPLVLGPGTLTKADDGRQPHGPGQDGSMRVGRALAGGEAEHLGGVHLCGLAGGQVGSHDDGRLVLLPCLDP